MFRSFVTIQVNSYNKHQSWRQNTMIFVVKSNPVAIDLLHTQEESRITPLDPYSTYASTRPVPYFLSIPDENVVQVACGENFYLALTSSGKVYSWGTGNKYGQLGREIPVSIENKVERLFEMSKVRQIVELESIIQITGTLFENQI
jgi:alpha-tubulin suppressor-like RCC1 family protein